jgi:hypothetical protein
MGLLGDLAHHAVDFWLSTEDLPDPENRVTVDSAGNLTLNYTPNNQVSQQKLYERPLDRGKERVEHSTVDVHAFLEVG